MMLDRWLYPEIISTLLDAISESQIQRSQAMSVTRSNFVSHRPNLHYISQ